MKTIRHERGLGWLLGALLGFGGVATAEYTNRQGVTGASYGYGVMPPRPAYGYGPALRQPMMPPRYGVPPMYKMWPAPHMRPYGPPKRKMPAYAGRAPVPARAASGYGTASAAPPVARQDTANTEPGQTATVGISRMRFDAPSVTIEVGGSVVWKNNENMPHTVVASDGSFGSPQLGLGEEFTRIFDRAGTFGYYCSLHPMMRGEVVVVE